VHHPLARSRAPRRALAIALVGAIVVIGAAIDRTAPPASAGMRAQRNPTITLLTHDSFAVSDDVLASFTRRTGIAVKILPAGDAGTMVNQAILTKGNPLGDVLFGVDNTFLTRALDAGIFERYRSPALDTVPEDLRLDPRHRVTPVDYGDVCINYDRDWFARRGLRVPRTLADLTARRYRDLLVVQDPSISSPGLAFLLATVAEFGPGGWQEYWRDLRANGVLVVDGWEQAYYDEFSGGGAGGQRPLVVSYASSPPAAVYFADPPTDEARTGTMTASCFRQVEFAGILRGTKERAAARRFVDFLLSERFQADIPLQMFVFPAREGTPLPEVFERFAEVPEDPITMAPRRIGRHRDAWIREWTGIVLR
jgi:thiamine transport system substrate-binding protein